MSERISRCFRIYGRVQGVGFRWSLCARAQELGLRVWVRNRSDGSVEALVHGPLEAVELLTAWARRGPSSARVERLEVMEGAVEMAEISDGFEQRPTC